MKNPMTKIVTMFSKLLCVIVMLLAISGAGLASNLGLYQPNVPKRISK